MIAVNRLQQHRNADTRTCGNRFSSIVRGANASTRLLAGSMKTWCGSRCTDKRWSCRGMPMFNPDPQLIRPEDSCKRNMHVRSARRTILSAATAP